MSLIKKTIYTMCGLDVFGSLLLIPFFYFDSNDNELWVKGKTFAKSQNLARKLMEMPANKLTPSAFSEIVTTKLVDACSYDQSKLTVRSQ